jgi:fucose 4-O-acetylase-like acetyltransferase
VGEARSGGVTQHERVAHLDNVKAILVVLVVVGHAIEALRGRAPEGLYAAIYSFHMPAFVLLSGYLSRNWEPDARRLRVLVGTLALPFMIFQVLLGAEFALLTGTAFPRDLATPRGATWFLLALMWWRLGTPVLRALRHPVACTLVVAVALPLDPNVGSLLAIGRTAGLVPFFALGMVLRPRVFEWLGWRAVRGVAWVALAGIVAGGLMWGWRIDRGFLYHRAAYDADDGLWTSMAIRLAALAIGLVGAAAITAIASRRRRWYTVVGVNSLSVYLVHLVVLQAARWVEPAAGILRGDGGVGVTAAVVGAGVALALALGTARVTRATAWLVHPARGSAWLVR